MAFQTGTATNAENLLALFRTFITSSTELAAESPSQVWAEEEYTTYTDSNGNTRYELYLRGPGLAGTDNIYVNIDLFKDIAAGTDAWTWTCHGATSYNSSLEIHEQPGALTHPKYMPLWDQSIPYWFFANGRRFIIIAQITASVYVNCYSGFLLPFAPSITALEYRYPLFIGASMADPGQRFSDTNNGDHRSFWHPCHSSDNGGGSSIYTPGNQWLDLRNVDAGGTNVSALSGLSTVGIVEPYSAASRTSSTPLVGVQNIQPLFGGDYLLTDCVVSRPNVDRNLQDRYGVLDGVAHISGVGQSSQNTVTVGSDTYYVFQEAFRTGTGDFVAIKQ